MSSRTKAERLDRFVKIDLYPVTSASCSNGRTSEYIVEQVVSAQCEIVQLREKSLSKREYYQLANRVRQISSDILLICNDHVDVALAVGADGVHLGQQDLPIRAARALAPNLLLGASTHSLEEALTAQQAGADYVNIGPIFPTKTKEGLNRFLTPQAILRIAPHLSIPFTVMGGINQDNIDEVLRAGARRIAVVSAITKDPQPARAAADLRSSILSFNSYQQQKGPTRDSINR